MTLAIGALICLGIMAGASVVKTLIMYDMARRVTKEDVLNSQLVASLKEE